MNPQLRSKLQRLNSRARRLYGLPKCFEKVEVCANPIFESAMRFADSNRERCLTILRSRFVEEPWRYRDAFEFLGIPFEPRPVDHRRVIRVNLSLPSALPRSYSNPWQNWTPEQRRIFGRVAGRKMVLYGFLTREKLALEPQADVIEPLPLAGGAGS